MTKREFDRELQKAGMAWGKSPRYIAITYNCEFPVSRLEGMSWKQKLDCLKEAQNTFLTGAHFRRVLDPQLCLNVKTAQSRKL